MAELITGTEDSPITALSTEGEANIPANADSDDDAAQSDKRLHDAQAKMHEATEEAARLRAENAALKATDELVDKLAGVVGSNSGPTAEEVAAEQRRIVEGLQGEDGPEKMLELVQDMYKDTSQQNADARAAMQKVFDAKLAELQGNVSTQVLSSSPEYQGHKEIIDAFATKHGVDLATATKMVNDLVTPTAEAAPGAPGNTGGVRHGTSTTDTPLTAEDKALFGQTFNKEEIAAYEAKKRAR